MMQLYSLLSIHPKRLLSAFALVGIVLGAQAEGSKNITPGTGARGTATGSNNFVGYLQHDDGAVASATSNSKYFLKSNIPTTVTDRTQQRLHVRVLPNETLYYGVRRITTNDLNNSTTSRLRLELKYLNGNTETTVKSSYLLPLATQPTTQEVPNLAAGPGVIRTPEEAAAGPRLTTGGAGYDPLTYTNTTGAAQDFWVEFEQVNRNNNNLTTQTKSWYDCWDFTVRDATGEKPGRLYSQHWSFSAAGGTNQLSDNFKLFTLIPNPNFNNENFFIKRVSYSGIQPFGVILVANSQGTTVAGDFKEKRKSRATNIGYPEYKLFVNDPDPSLYPTTVRPGTPTVITSCAAGSTTFTLNVDQAGFGVVFIDGDSNGAYNPATDRVLEQNTVIGNNAFVWDGNSDSGAKITATTLSVTFSSGVGPANFPIWDCEQAPNNGISVQDVRPGNNGATDYIFWDDSPLGAGFSTPLVNPIGNNTDAGSHKWTANAGNEKLVNSYAVGLLARGNAIQITYDPNTICATAAEVKLEVPLPVELSSFTARLQEATVLVKWETASERNCASFLVERSTDGRHFAALGQVAGHGTTNRRHTYTFVDGAPVGGIAYYRLRQLDTDGTAQYSPLVAVKSPTQVAQAVLYPNPATTSVTVRFAEAIQGPVTLRIVNATGRVLWTQSRSLSDYATLLEIPTAQLPAAGLYLLQVTGTGFSGTYRFAK